jgi:hypothetical protein
MSRAGLEHFGGYKSKCPRLGIVDHFFCFVCDEYVWDCDHLIEERRMAPGIPALEGSKLQSFAYDGASRTLEIEFRVRAP